MKRRSRAGQRPARARPRKALKRKGGSAPKAVSLGRSSLGQTEVARLTRELKEAQEQQAATADLLKVISHIVTSKGRLLVRVICMVFDRYLRERQARAAYSKVI